MEIIGYITAVGMGVTLGLLGGGGSILTVPILVYLFQQSAETATGYSLFVVGLSSLIASVSYHFKGLINYKVGVIFAVPSIIGVYMTRRYVVPSIPTEIFEWQNFILTKDVLIMTVFALVMLLASISMIKKPKYKAKKNDSKSFNYPLIAAEGLIVGGVTGFVGAGGGFLIVPAIVLLAKLEMKSAVATSLAIISVKSLLGFLGDVQVMSGMNWGFLLTFSALSVVGILLGIKLSAKMKSDHLKPIFGYFVLVMGVFILLSQVIS
jgi:uncharacterized membrane protein YfcA